MAMKNPPHPGRSIRENCLIPLCLNVTEAAKVLGVARHTLSRVLNGHAAISPEMAIRLEKAGWSNAEFWLRRQTTYELGPSAEAGIPDHPSARDDPGRTFSSTYPHTRSEGQSTIDIKSCIVYVEDIFRVPACSGASSRRNEASSAGCDATS